METLLRRIAVVQNWYCWYERHSRSNDANLTLCAMYSAKIAQTFWRNSREIKKKILNDSKKIMEMLLGKIYWNKYFEIFL